MHQPNWRAELLAVRYLEPRASKAQQKHNEYAVKVEKPPANNLQNNGAEQRRKQEKIPDNRPVAPQDDKIEKRYRIPWHDPVYYRWHLHKHRYNGAFNPGDVRCAFPSSGGNQISLINAKPPLLSRPGSKAGIAGFASISPRGAEAGTAGEIQPGPAFNRRGDFRWTAAEL